MFPMYPALSYRTPGYRPENKPRSYPRLGDTSKPDRREVPIAATHPTGHVQDNATDLRRGFRLCRRKQMFGVDREGNGPTEDRQKHIDTSAGLKPRETAGQP